MSRNSAVEPTSRNSVKEPPSGPINPLLKPARDLLKYGIESTNSLAGLYKTLTKKRGRGAPTHKDQDLLRAMLVMAGATLDIVVKRIVRDTLHAIVKTNPEARSKASEHVYRHLLRSIEGGGGQRLAEALVSESPQDAIVKLIIDDVTGGSMQSVEVLEKTAAYLGLKNFEVIEGVKDALKARNQIVHEMDASEAQHRGRGSRRRRQRNKDEMTNWAQALLKQAEKLCEAVDEELSKAGKE